MLFLDKYTGPNLTRICTVCQKNVTTIYVGYCQEEPWSLLTSYLLHESWVKHQIGYPHRQNLRMLSKNIEVEIRAQGERKKGSQRVGEDSPKHASSNHVAPQMVVAPPADQHVAKALVRELVVSWNVQDFVLDFSPFLNGEDLPLPCV